MAARKNGDSTKNNLVEIHRMGEMFKSSASFSSRLEILQKSRIVKMYNNSNKNFGSSGILAKNKYQNLDIPVVVPSSRNLWQVQERSLTDQSYDTRPIS